MSNFSFPQDLQKTHNIINSPSYYFLLFITLFLGGVLMYRYLYLDSMFILYTASNVKIYLDTMTNSLYILYSMYTTNAWNTNPLYTVYISSGHTRRSRRSWSMETRRNKTRFWGTKSIIFHTIFLLQFIQVHRIQLGVFSLLEYLFFNKWHWKWWFNNNLSRHPWEIQRSIMNQKKYQTIKLSVFW